MSGSVWIRSNLQCIGFRYQNLSSQKYNRNSGNFTLKMQAQQEYRHRQERIHQTKISYSLQRANNCGIKLCCYLRTVLVNEVIELALLFIVIGDSHLCWQSAHLGISETEKHLQTFSSKGGFLRKGSNLGKPRFLCLLESRNPL
jgi:hypothetical protein